MLAGGGPRVQPARVRWPLHVALREAHEAARRGGEAGAMGARLHCRPSADVGVEVCGADRAFDQLVRTGVLRPEGQMRTAQLLLDGEAEVLWRRRLMKLEPRQAAWIQRAGTRWAALASTASKNRATASPSVTSTVTSSTPKRANLLVVESA